MNITKENLETAPKQFIDSSLQAFAKEYFLIVFGSGEMVNGMAFSPIHFKQISNGMLKTLQMYEEKYGAINIENQPVISPIQMDNLSGGGKV